MVCQAFTCWGLTFNFALFTDTLLLHSEFADNRKDKHQNAPLYSLFFSINANSYQNLLSHIFLQMAPLRRKNRNSQSPSNAPGSPIRTPTQFPRSPMKPTSTMTPMKSPLRQVRPAGITKKQKATIIENLNLESTFGLRITWQLQQMGI